MGNSWIKEYTVPTVIWKINHNHSDWDLPGYPQNFLLCKLEAKVFFPAPPMSFSTVVVFKMRLNTAAKQRAVMKEDVSSQHHHSPRTRRQWVAKS